APAVLYAVLVVPQMVDLLASLMNPQLDAIAALLGTPLGATIAWAHFLAFDLFVGRWVYLDARERGLSAWIVSPLLALTLMLGPLGFLLYLLARRLPGPAASRHGSTR
ncbi:MAG TPA: ABA4-like family protein, partial [Anaerolineales bacterium]|nr:ABA4-like family protein [Anaerolineales bacterium]